MHTDISSRFNYERLFRFVLPSVVMMIFISTYTMVDGFFVSNYVGKTAFTAVNLIFPAIMVFACVGFMFGAGGSALVAKTMGEGQMEKANRLFSLIVLSALAADEPPVFTLDNNALKLKKGKKLKRKSKK